MDLTGLIRKNRDKEEWTPTTDKKTKENTLRGWGEILTDVIWGKKYEKAREKGENVKEKRRKGKEKEKKGKQMRKG
jgi:hypothetical protein